MPRKTPTHQAASGVPNTFSGRFTRSTGRVGRRTRPRRRIASGPRKMARLRRYRRAGAVTRSLRSTWTNPLSRAATYKFRYADNGYALTTGAGGIQTLYSFRGNGPFDPDATGAGVQPYGWDLQCQANNYQYYTCVGAKIKVKASLNDTTTDYVLSLVPMRQTPTYIDLSDLRVVPLSKQTRLSSNDRSNRTLSMYIRTTQMYPEFDDKNSNFRAAYNATPSYQWYFCIVGDTTSVAVSKALVFDVEITYYCKLMRSDDDQES